MRGRSLERRLAALEAAQRGPTDPDAIIRAQWEAARAERATVAARLAPLGWSYSPDSWHLHPCGCCGWRRPALVPPFQGNPNYNAQVHRCPVCGAQEFGLIGPRIASYFAAAYYTCPRCDHAYTGPRAAVTPCPACAFAAPPYTDEQNEVWLEVMVAALVRAYGPAVVAAWLNYTDADLAPLAAELTTWWFDTVQDALNKETPR